MKHLKTFNEISENISERIYGKDGLINSHTIPKEMKEKILPFVNDNSYYYNKKMIDLTIPDGKNFDGVSLGADKNGFFVMTHRARSKSYESPDKIPHENIIRTASTG